MSVSSTGHYSSYPGVTLCLCPVRNITLAIQGHVPLAVRQGDLIAHLSGGQVWRLSGVSFCVPVDSGR